MINWELCKELKFRHANKWYMHNPESVQENEMHKSLWYLEIPKNHLTLARRPDLVIVNEKERTYPIVDYTIAADHRVKLKEN